MVQIQMNLEEEEEKEIKETLTVLRIKQRFTYKYLK